MLSDRLARVPRWQAHLLLLLAFALVAAPLIGYKATHNRALSVFDEWQYADRVHAVATGDWWMSRGEVIGDWAQGTRACRGITRVVGPQPAPCWGKEPVPLFNSAVGDPPPYFWATGAITGVLLWSGLTDNAVTTARLVGVLWAALSMWSLFLLSRALGAGRGASLVAASTVLLVPAFLQQYVYITPHALDIPVGAFGALVVLRYLRREWPWWTVVLAGLGAAGVKGSNVAVVVVLGLALLAVLAWPTGLFDRATRVRALVGGVVLAVSTVVFTGLWQVLLRLTEVVDEVPPPGDYLVESLDPKTLLIDSIRFVSTFGEDVLLVPGIWFMTALTGTALALWAGLLPDARPFVRQIGFGYVVGALLAPVVLDLMVFLTSGQYIGIHVRYGLAVLPVGVALAALLLRTRTAVVLAAAFLVIYAVTPTWAGLDSIAM